jgi:hypothetical protein
MVKDYLGADQRRIRHDDKSKEEKEIKVKIIYVVGGE